MWTPAIVAPRCDPNEQDAVDTVASTVRDKLEKRLTTATLRNDWFGYAIDPVPPGGRRMAMMQDETIAQLQRANETLRQERDDALAQKAALAEVLDTINRSPDDPEPVFEAVLEKAHTLCGAAKGGFLTFDGTHFRAVATRGYPDEYAAAIRRPLAPNEFQQKLIEGERYVHIHDFRALTFGSDDHHSPGLVQLTDIRTALAIPLRRDGAFLGFISAFRNEVRPFADNEIALLENFAAQAVIAMENARLLTEQREALEQQTATAEVLQVINRSPGNLAPVFDAMLEKAIHLCGSAFGMLHTFDGERFHSEAMRGVPTALVDFLREPRLPSPGMALHRIVHGEDVVHIADITDDEVYRSGNPARRALADLGGVHTMIWIALRRDDILLGLFAIYRQEVPAILGKAGRAFAEFRRPSGDRD